MGKGKGKGRGRGQDGLFGSFERSGEEEEVMM